MKSTRKSNRPRTRGHEEEYASAEESRAAIQVLEAVELKKLLLIAAHFCRSRKVQEKWAQPDDLLQEAFLRTLDGRRRWRKAVVSLVRHLDRSMESISSHLVEESMKAAKVVQLAYPFASGESAREARAPPQKPSKIEDQAAAREELRAIRAMFENDEAAWAFLSCRAQGMQESEILSELGMSKREYDAVRQRIRRAFVRSRRR